MDPTVVSTVLPSQAPRGAHALAELRRAIEVHRARPLAELLVDRGLGAYRGYGELLEHVETLVEAGARLTVAGRSVCGEALFLLALGRDGTGPDDRTTAVLSGLHPMEWIAVEAHLALLDRLVAAPPVDRSLVSIVVANPDGWLKVEQHLRDGRRRLVRHNAHGVDLNRNFDSEWGRRALAARLVPWLFRPGRHPGSEPEVSAVAQSLATRRIDRALALHSFGSCVLYPSGPGLFAIADAAEHRAWARNVSQALGPRSGRACPSSRLVPGFGAGGMELEWFHRRHGALSLLVECPGGGIPSALRRAAHPFAWYNPERPREVAHRVADAVLPFVRGSDCQSTR